MPKDRYFIVDQLEGDWAVLETPDRERLELSHDELPDDAEEGSMLVRHEDGEGAVSFTVDHEAGAKRLEEMEALRASLPKAPEGDL